MTGWLFWLGIAALVLAAASALALWSYGHFARRARGLPSQAIPPGAGGELDALIPDAGDSAALSFEAAEALALRLASIQMACRSIDVMTYIWSDDRAGRLVAQALIEAAARGVRVRLLLDDVNILGRDPVWLALDRQPGIEVRVFNPVRARHSAVRRGIEMLLLAVRYNRRMHGKVWLADGRLALAGGRNVGDIYFGLARGRKRNVEDADILLTGPIVAETAEVFDAFWNADLALPIAALWRGRLPALPAALRRRRRLELAEAAALSEPERLRAALARVLARRRGGGRLRLLADPPGKALGLKPGPRGGREWLPDRLVPVIATARRSVTIATPYLVPGRAGLAELLAMAGRGVQVVVVTNTLAVIDHALVHGAYRWYRQRLLPAGVAIREYGAEDLLDAAAGTPAPQPARMLHAKVALIDDEAGYVGSFNFDLRSAWLNTELGVLFDDPGLLAETRAWIDWAQSPERAYEVTRFGRWTAWRRGDGAKLWFEPRTGVFRRLLAFVVGHLPIHRWL